MEVFELTVADPDKVEFCLTGIRHLVPQLSSSRGFISYNDFFDIIESDTTSILFAVHDDEIVGSLTLVTFKIPTGIRSWIEDVVVDETVRGMGIGQALNEAALDLAKEKGAKTVDLTSRPSREAANRLYQRMGFELRESNLYRFNL